MKILNLEIEGFRSFRNVSWTPSDLNLVIGPNGSGKSNLLRLLELLSWSARGGLSKYAQREGGMESLLWDGRVSNIIIRSDMSPLDVSDDQIGESLTYAIDLARIGTSSEYRIASETLANAESIKRGATDLHHRIFERLQLHTLMLSEKGESFAPRAGAMSEGETLLSLCTGPFTPNIQAALFRDGIGSWAIYQGFQTHHEAPIRQAIVARSETQVQSDGQNLISVLHTLYTGNRDFKSELNTAMRAAFGDDFDELVFPPAADQRIQLRVRWKSLQREQSAADLSDGTLRFLYLLAILANPSPPPLIAIDEPETGLHPSMLPIIAEYARDASTRTQVILTTHSPDLLDAFGKDAPTTTVVEWKNGQTELRVLAGDNLDYWLKQYTLGELYRSNELESMR